MQVLADIELAQSMQKENEKGMEVSHLILCVDVCVHS